MKIIKMLIFGSIGIVVAGMVFFIMLLISDYVLGLVVSLLGSLAGAQAVLGYIGKDRPGVNDFKKIVRIGAVFGLLAALLPYIFLLGFQDSAAFIFVAISALGGYQIARSIFIYKATESEVHSVKKIILKKTDQKIPLSLRLKIVMPRLLSIITINLLIATVIVVLGLVLNNGLGVVWLLFVLFVARNIWRSRALIVTDRDLNPPPKNSQGSRSEKI